MVREEGAACGGVVADCVGTWVLCDEWCRRNSRGVLKNEFVVSGVLRGYGWQEFSRLDVYVRTIADAALLEENEEARLKGSATKDGLLWRCL